MIKKTIKIASGVIIIVLLTIIIFDGKDMLTMWAFSQEEVSLVDSWKVGDYSIRLTSHLAWSGPGSYRYTLYERGLFGKQLGISYSGIQLSDDDSCLVIFREGDGFKHNKENFHFDKCKMQVDRIK